MIDGFKQSPAIIQLAKTIEANGIKPLEDVTVLSVLRCATVLLDEALYLFEPGDDALFARRRGRSLLIDLDTQGIQKLAVGQFGHRPASAVLRARKATPSAIR